MDKRKYISGVDAVYSILLIWMTAVSVGYFDADWFVLACSFTVGIALSEARFNTKIDNERKESE